jgi:antitoxin component HigA of HigAB toxin-antitoxin module
MLTLPYRVRGSTPLIKDPIALLSAEWLEEVYGARVVVMVRHPAAFVGSLKVKNWTFPFEDLLNQDEAMRDHFDPHKEKILQFTQTDKDIVDQASFIWKLLYSVVSKYQERHPEWTFVRHEDAVRDPIPHFRRVYEQLGLTFADKVKNKIDKKTDPSVIRNWKKRLTKEEIDRVRRKTEPVASIFYTSNEW